MNKNVIFFITGVELRPLKTYHKRYVEYNLPHYDNNTNSLVFDIRTFGWAPTFEMAEEWVKNNDADISEGGTCRWIVIEGFTPGLYLYKPFTQVFFEFIGDWETDGHYEKIEVCPKQIEDLYIERHLVKSFATIG